jgi:hypothetical protein
VANKHIPVLVAPDRAVWGSEEQRWAEGVRFAQKTVDTVNASIAAHFETMALNPTSLPASNSDGRHAGRIR